MRKTPAKSTKKPSTEVAQISTALDDLLQEDSGAGFEEATRDAYAVPFLVVLQDLSPQVKKKMSGYVEGAKPGMIYNTVTKELFTELRIIPCYFSQVHIEWIARNEKEDGRSGLIAVHPANTPLVSRAKRDGSRMILPNGHLLEDTRQHFVLFQREDGTVDQAMIGMKSTQLKISRRWMAQQRAALITIGDRVINPPSYAWSYHVSTEEDANAQGSWYSWNIGEKARVEDMAVYNQARAFCAMMREGKVRVNYEDEAMSDGAEASQVRGRGDDAPADLDEDGNEIDA